MVPPQNIRTTINSRGAKDTTIMVPEQHLPLVMPLKYVGIDEDTLNKLDRAQAQFLCDNFFGALSTKQRGRRVIKGIAT